MWQAAVRDRMVHLQKMTEEHCGKELAKMDKVPPPLLASFRSLAVLPDCFTFSHSVLFLVRRLVWSLRRAECWSLQVLLSMKDKFVKMEEKEKKEREKLEAKMEKEKEKMEAKLEKEREKMEAESALPSHPSPSSSLERLIGVACST